MFLNTFVSWGENRYGYVGDYIDLKRTDANLYDVKWEKWAGSVNCITLTSPYSNPCSVHIDSYFSNYARIKCSYSIRSGNTKLNKVEYYDIYCNPVLLNPTPASMTMKVEDKEAIVIHPLPSDKHPSVSYESSRPSVATVSVSGVVTAIGEGTATITLTNSMGPNETIGVKVENGNIIYVTDISITGNSSEPLSVGGIMQLGADVYPSDATNKSVTWSSDKLNVAIVDDNSGLVEAIGEGEAIITCKAKDGSGVTATCKVKVNTIPPIDISLPSSKTINEGESFIMPYTLTPPNATTELSWSSDDKNIATVSSSGMVKGIKAGTTKIRVKTSNGLSDYCNVTVEDKWHDGDIFTAKTVEGVEMKYMVISAIDKTCSVSGGFDVDGLGIPAIDTKYAGKITIPSEAQGFKVKSIGFQAFDSCEKLVSAYLSDGIELIEYYGFARCKKLISVRLPESLKHIQSYAFDDCTSLESIFIPKNVCSLGENDDDWGWGAHCLEGTSSLSSIIVDEDNAYYDSRDNCNAIISTATNTLIIGCKNTIIPNSVTTIGHYAFSYCSGLTSVTIPNSVTSIESWAFHGCSLIEIAIPKSVTNIGKNPFSSCNLSSVTVETENTTYDSRNGCNAIIETATNSLITGCKNTIIPDDVTGIGDEAFYYCGGLTSVTIPNSVTTIEYDAFGLCHGLTDVYCQAENVPETKSTAFSNSPIASATLHVPSGSLNAYRTMVPWSGFGTIVAIENETIKKGDLNGDGTVSITDVVMIIDVIADPITYADKKAVADVNSDGSVTITDCVAAIDLIAAQSSSPRSARTKAHMVFSNTDFISASMGSGQLTVNLDNEKRYTAFQMIVNMPEGMAIGRATMDKTRGADHQIIVRDLGNGQYLVAGFSANNDEFVGNSGSLFSIVTDGQAEGDIIISDIEFATTQAEACHLADITLSSTPTGIETIHNSKFIIQNDDAIFDLQGRRVVKPTKGLYIYNGKKTVIK